MPNGAMLPAGTTDSRARKVSWATSVREVAFDAMGELEVWHGPIRLMAEFCMPYPTSSIRKYQFGWLGHVKKPDIDKLMRALLDPLKGIVWRDDSQVCFSNVNKVYAWNDRPGCYVVVDFLTDEFMQRHGRAAHTIVDVIESL